ncbi:CRISPR-associated protein, Csy1 family [Chitinispirillum alkaliphilum]|nr:CRISPR-associated protein, Csy1 family [Chitinispirillum alkaliphilum]
MLDPAIQEFFQKRKDDWLKKRVKPTVDDEERGKLEEECEEKFSRECWLPDAAKRAGQINVCTHPCTFSHPSARKNKNGYATSVIADNRKSPDGYLRTGNIEIEKDAYGNAAALDVYNFLASKMQDGKSLLQHIENDSELAKEMLKIESESYENLKAGFLAMSRSSIDNITSSKIKQVYFPTDKGYHLLSILSNSGLIYELRRRVDDLRFSEKQKETRDLKRKNSYSTQGFSEIFDITTIGYGGTKPQNISVMNNQFGGKARLLPSVPPAINKRNINFPKKNFFISSIRFYDIREPLQKLHGIFTTGTGSEIPLKNLRSGRDYRIEEILDCIIERMVALRAVAKEQYREENSNLLHHQKVWLCDEYREEREKQDEWLDEVCNEIGQWIARAYEKIIKKAVTLGPAERAYIKNMISTHREVLR